MLLGALWLICFGGAVMWGLQGDRGNLLPMGVGYRAAFTGAGLLWAGFMTALVPGEGVKRGATGVTAALLLGAAALVIADVLARTVLAPIQLPVGVVTALLGVPLFLFILSGRR